jgi:hypothetical protein
MAVEMFRGPDHMAMRIGIFPEPWCVMTAMYPTGQMGAEWHQECNPAARAVRPDAQDGKVRYLASASAGTPAATLRRLGIRIIDV